MGKNVVYEKNDMLPRIGYLVLLCLIGISFNVAGNKLATLLNISLYLDSMGTIFSAIVGGYIPAIAVGLLSNIIISLTNDPISVYYASLNVMIAVSVTFLSHRGFLEKTKGRICVILITVMIGGGLGSLLSWFLNISAYETFLSGLMNDLILDLIDKSISFFIVLSLIKVIPDSVLSKLQFNGWQQTPLTYEALKKAKKNDCRGFSLRYKFMVALMFAISSVAVTSLVISVILYRNTAVAEYTKLGQGISGAVAGMIDAEAVDEYLTLGEEAEGYLETEQRLYKLRESAEDVEYIYVFKIDKDGCHVVFDLDTDELEGESSGSLLEFDESFEPVLPDLLTGKTIDPIISNHEYGWLLTIYTPVYNNKGECVCYACADIRMATLVSDQITFFTKLLSIFLGFFITILAIGLWLAEYRILIPINTMAYATGAFAFDTIEERKKSVERINELGIHTGDEIENLYHAITETTNESMRYVADLQKQTKAIEDMQNGMILVLADMVESRDKNTGQHVRKTAAYTKIIMDQMLKEGLHTEELTEEFIYDVYHSAPLHDVGKITIPDAILNKPGRLDEEEYNIMRSHAAAGRDIISRIIKIAPDSNYMKEARNLAAYHHERWDGKGYPDGLAGEEIPLSARIMAVADVFDALYSKRSYKEGFSFEKSISIIEEGIGTQFDPDVARAFLHAKDIVYDTAELLNDGEDVEL